MYEAIVLIRVNSEKFAQLSREEQLAFIKKHMGGYNDYDIARLVEVKEVEAAE